MLHPSSPAGACHLGGSGAPRIVCATGPESTGKTALCQHLSATFGVPWLAEYAREYLAGRTGYDEADVAAIAREQMRREAALVADGLLRGRQAGNAAGGVVLDTDLSVILIWWRERFGPPPAWLEDAFAAQSERRYLLCRPDLPWQPDRLRETAGDQCLLRRHYQAYRHLLEEHGRPYVEISGVGPAREEAAVRAAASCLAPSLPD